MPRRHNSRLRLTPHSLARLKRRVGLTDQGWATRERATRVSSETSITARRVVIVGCCGSGKTTLAQKVALQLGLTLIQRDVFDDQDDPSEGPPERQKVGVLHAMQIAPQGWILDAAPYWYENDVYPKAELIVALDYPKPIVVGRCLKRSLRNVLAGRERPLAFLERDHPLRWAWKVHAERRREIVDLTRNYPSVVVLRSPNEASEWLAKVVGDQ